MKLKIYIILFLLSLSVSYLGLINFDKLELLFTGNKEYLYTPDYNKDSIYEINLIYIGSSQCKYSNSKDLYRSIDIIKSLIQDKSKENDIGFSAIGIAAEWDSFSGIDHLSNFGYFDEIISGNNWSNNGIAKYVGEMGEEASTPQIILTFRMYTELIQSNIVEEKRILNLKGKNQIINWLKKGTPLPKEFIQELRLKLTEEDHIIN